MASKKSGSKKSSKASKADTEVNAQAVQPEQAPTEQPQESVPSVQAETIQNQQDHLAQLASEALKLKEANANLSAQVGTLTAELDTAKDVRADFEARAETAGKQFAEVRDSRDALANKVAELTEENAKLKATVDQLEANNAAMTKARDDLAAKAADVADNLKEEIAKLKAQLAAQPASNSDADLAAEIETLKATIAKQNEVILSQTTEKDSLRAEIAALKAGQPVPTVRRTVRQAAAKVARDLPPQAVPVIEF